MKKDKSRIAGIDLGVRNLMRRGCEGFQQGKSEIAEHICKAGDKDRQENEEIISEEGS